MMSLYKQGGKASSIFIRLAGISKLFPLKDPLECLNIETFLGGMSAVILGAYGAHRQFKSSDETRDPKAIFETANRYHFFHSIALIAMPLTKRPFLVK